MKKFLKFTGKVLAGCLIALVFGALIVVGLLWLSANVDWSFAKTQLSKTAAPIPTSIPKIIVDPQHYGKTEVFNIAPLAGYITVDGKDPCTKIDKAGFVRMNFVVFINKYKNTEVGRLEEPILVTPGGEEITKWFTPFSCSYRYITTDEKLGFNTFVDEIADPIYGNTDGYVFSYLVNKKAYMEETGDYELVFHLDQDVIYRFRKSDLLSFETEKDGLGAVLFFGRPTFDN